MIALGYFFALNKPCSKAPKLNSSLCLSKYCTVTLAIKLKLHGTVNTQCGVIKTYYAIELFTALVLLKFFFKVLISYAVFYPVLVIDEAFDS